jgi:hypothetical protein
MIDPRHFRVYIIRPALQVMGMASEAAENLMLGTAIVESNLTWLKQGGKGPALGLFQMEPATHQDLWDNYLNFHDDTTKRLANLMVLGSKPFVNQLVWNLGYATAMARLLYYRRPEPLPHHKDAMGLAMAHKQWYNTPLGKTKVEESVVIFENIVKGKY